MAVTGDYQFDVDGFTFGLGTSTSVVSISGLDMPEIDVATNAAGNRHGASTAGRYLKERTIGLNGRINGSYSTFPALRDTLVRAFRPRKTDTDIRFTFRLPGRTNQYIFVKPVNLRGDIGNSSTAVGWWDFNATLVAQDPRIYTDVLQTATLTVAGGAVVLNNGGNFEAPISISFNGQLTTPRISNATTGENFGLLGNVDLAQSVVADTLNNTVLLGATSKYSTINPAFKTWLELAPGNNSLTLLGTGTGNAVVSWRSTSI